MNWVNWVNQALKIKPCRALMLRQKRGTSLLEAILSICILAIVVVAVVGSIGIARKSIIESNVKDTSAAEAQAIVDTLIQELSIELDPAGVEAVKQKINDTYGAEFQTSDSFLSANGDKQFTFSEVSTNGIAGYTVAAAVFYTGGEEYTVLRGYTSKSSGEFVPAI